MQVPGDTLFHDGAVADKLFIIFRGQVALQKADTDVVSGDSAVLAEKGRGKDRALNAAEDDLSEQAHLNAQNKPNGGGSGLGGLKASSGHGKSTFVAGTARDRREREKRSRNGPNITTIGTVHEGAVGGFEFFTR